VEFLSRAVVISESSSDDDDSVDAKLLEGSLSSDSEEEIDKKTAARGILASSSFVEYDCFCLNYVYIYIYILYYIFIYIYVSICLFSSFLFRCLVSLREL
jgi:hypothetical protein